MKEPLQKIKKMDSEFNIFKMETYIKVNIKMENFKVKVNIFGKIVLNIMVNLVRVEEMD